MSDKPISVGDLVMVVREGDPCVCGNRSRTIGWAFRVGEILAAARCCASCGKSRGTTIVVIPDDRKDGFIFPLHRLKRLDPDALKDDVPTREELHA